MIVSTVWGSPGMHDRHELPKTTVLSVDEAAGSELRAKARSGGRVRLFAELDTRWTDIPLLTAEIHGESDDFVLFSGHVDSWHYGAMDNGSATSRRGEPSDWPSGRGTRTAATRVRLGTPTITGSISGGTALHTSTSTLSAARGPRS